MPEFLGDFKDVRIVGCTAEEKDDFIELFESSEPDFKLIAHLQSTNAFHSRVIKSDPDGELYKGDRCNISENIEELVLIFGIPA